MESAKKTSQHIQARQQNTQDVDSILTGDQDYSLWTSKAFTPFVNEDNDTKVEEKDTANLDDTTPNDVSYSISHSISDELIPFSDSPQISRFGPISRKGITSMRNKPSQSQAIIDDQAHVSPVVSNSKQMSRPAPSLPTAFLQQTNGTFMALQPVALGVNGEIGYVAVQQPNPENNFVPGQEIATLSIALSNSALGTLPSSGSLCRLSMLSISAAASSAATSSRAAARAASSRSVVPRWPISCS